MPMPVSPVEAGGGSRSPIRSSTCSGDDVGGSIVPSGTDPEGSGEEGEEVVNEYSSEAIVGSGSE